jgi:hypothetical protein
MNGKEVLIALALIVLANSDDLESALAAADRADQKNRDLGSVMPCSLDGVNPVLHPEVFGNPATALQYGFVRAKNGTWQVVPNCHR